LHTKWWHARRSSKPQIIASDARENLAENFLVWFSSEIYIRLTETWYATLRYTMTWHAMPSKGVMCDMLSWEQTWQVKQPRNQIKGQHSQQTTLKASNAHFISQNVPELFWVAGVWESRSQLAFFRMLDACSSAVNGLILNIAIQQGQFFCLLFFGEFYFRFLSFKFLYLFIILFYFIFLECTAHHTTVFLARKICYPYAQVDNSCSLNLVKNLARFSQTDLRFELVLRILRKFFEYGNLRTKKGFLRSQMGKLNRFCRSQNVFLCTKSAVQRTSCLDYRFH